MRRSQQSEATMVGYAFLVMLPVGAALVALWADFRLADRRPRSPALRIAHAGAAWVALDLATDAVGAATDATFVREASVLFLVFLPSLIYAFLAAIWTLRIIADAARLARH
jgi:hypothetical protein